ncbi:poly-gamma-glutamate hydrolase family protein [Actinoplanes sp. NPDC089786]|uniref:poly-gamma-glutamate hydrolase family protein n=1 Tax=Actinoplanes sp. NPDC089786 TaxID=3155185 RepID=UPI00341BD188
MADVAGVARITIIVEGLDYGRRYRRHAAFDDRAGEVGGAFPQTAVLALHGGGIEPGCSELALAVAGYHPATMAATAPVHDYSMYEACGPGTTANCTSPRRTATTRWPCSWPPVPPGW